MRGAFRPRRWLPLAGVPALLLVGFGVERHVTQRGVTPTATVRVLPTRVPPTAPPTATPSPTPVPSATAAPTTTAAPAQGVRTGGISYDMASLRAIQAAADRHEAAYQYALDPVRVTAHDLPGFGYSPGPVEILDPAPPAPSPTAHHGEDGLPETDVIVRYAGKRYWVVLNQFVRAGPGGIWSVITITPMDG